MKFLTDMHSHTFPASHDAGATLKEMFEGAQKKGLAFFGVSNHIDYDCDFSHLPEEERKALTNGDEEEYFHEARHLQEDYQGVMNGVIGAEFGFSEREEIQKRYQAFYEKFQPDFIVNSVHSADGRDYAQTIYTGTKKETYGWYLKLIRASLDAPYPYDIVGHIEYIVRYVPFEQREISVEEFGEGIDDILSTIIKKGKILEVNSATYTLPRKTLPNEGILRRYYELGGRLISYGSDAHTVERIADKRAEIMEILKKIGFTHLTVPVRGEYIKVEI